MLTKLKKMKERYLETEQLLQDPAVVREPSRFKEISVERAQLEPVVSQYDELLRVTEEMESLKEMTEEKDEALAELAREELASLLEKKEKLEEDLKLALIPVDPMDTKGAILEIRAGTGGEEAGLFAADLLNMYTRYAELHGYRLETMSESATEMGGIKEIVLSVQGKTGIYGRLKFESGVHRVQRVPVTETQGKIQTSAATVAVLPVVDDVQIDIKESDLQIDTYRSSGAGGQHVNKTESAIRITHLPTGIVVQCQDERSQYKNKDKAMKVLRSRLYEYYQGQQDASLAKERRSMVGSGDRSERIRTYNFPQNRVTDHRINMTLHKLDRFMMGEMDEMIDELIIQDRRERMTQA